MIVDKRRIGKDRDRGGGQERFVVIGGREQGAALYAVTVDGGRGCDQRRIGTGLIEVAAELVAGDIFGIDATRSNVVANLCEK